MNGLNIPGGRDALYSSCTASACRCRSPASSLQQLRRIHMASWGPQVVPEPNSRTTAGWNHQSAQISAGSPQVPRRKCVAREGRCVQFWSLRPLVASTSLRISRTCRSRALCGSRSGGLCSHAAETADLRGDAPHRPQQQAYVGVDAGPPPDQQYNVRGAPQATFLGAGWAALLLVRVLI